jgi:methyl-accepting chemotaxis protein
VTLQEKARELKGRLQNIKQELQALITATNEAENRARELVIHNHLQQIAADSFAEAADLLEDGKEFIDEASFTIDNYLAELGEVKSCSSIK